MEIPVICGARRYRLLQTALPAEQKRIRATLLPTLILVLAISTVVFIFLGVRASATLGSLVPYGLFMLAYMAHLILWSPRKLKRKLQRCWETYELEVGSNYLVRRQADLPDLCVQFSEVSAVQRIPGRDLRVIGTPKSNIISIPEGIEDYAEILAAVSSIRPVEERRLEQWQKTRSFLAAALIGYITMLWVTNPVVVIPLSIGMASVIVWIFFWLRQNPNLSHRMKMFAWYFLLFLVICGMKLLVAVTSYIPHQQK
jgi:hypothetical protein